MTVRPVRRSDRDELVRMRRALWPDSSEAEVDDVLALTASEGIILVAEGAAGGLLGFAEVGLRKFAEGCSDSPVAYLEGIWIDSDTRREGVGSALVKEAEAWACSSGFTELASDCDVGNAGSRAFHGALGFAEVQRNICFRRILSQESD